MVRSRTLLAYRLAGLFGLVAACGLVMPREAAAKRCPNIMFIADRTGTMGDPPVPGPPPSKWQLVVNAIKQTLSRYGKRVPFCLSTYSATGGGASCFNDTKVEVECQPLSPQVPPLIERALQMYPVPMGVTNTGEALNKAIDIGNLKDPTRGNYMVIITDGEPNCNQVKEPKQTFDAITRAANSNPPIHTFVVGFDGGGLNPTNLNTMAILGKEPRPGCDVKDPKNPMNLCYYSASNQTKFNEAIDAIIGSLAGATILAACDDSCFANECEAGKVCVIPSACAPPVCKVDPCSGVKCEEGMYCKDGHCLNPCPICLASEKCVQETCVPDSCVTRQQPCPDGTVCNPATGDCAPNLCITMKTECPLPSGCNALNGCCDDDPCRLVNCPPGTTCYGGYCGTDRPEVDMAVEGDQGANGKSDGGAKGDGGVPSHEFGCGSAGKARGESCAISSTREGSPGFGLLLAVAGAIFWMRRRRPR